MQIVSYVLTFLSWGMLLRIGLASGSFDSVPVTTVKLSTQSNEMPFKQTFHTSLVKSLISKGKNVKKGQLESIKAVDIIYPNADVTTPWVNTVYYSDNNCTSGREVMTDALVAGVCINYISYEGTSSLRLSCDSSSAEATASIFEAANCVPGLNDTTILQSMNTCVPNEGDWPSLQTFKVSCTAGSDTKFPSAVPWFVFKGYTGSSCTNLVENYAMRDGYCIDSSYERDVTSDYYSYPSHKYYEGSSVCQGNPSESYTYPISTCSTGSGETDYGYSYSIQYVPKATAKDTPIYYTVTQTFYGISNSVYQNYRSGVEQVLKAVIADIMTGVGTSEIDIQSYYDPYPGRKLSLHTEESFLRVEIATGETDTAQPDRTSSGGGTVVNSQYTAVVYQIAIPSVFKAGFTSAQDAYDKTTKELTDSILLGRFTGKIAYYATMYNVPVMRYVQANEQPAISDYSTSNNGSLAAAIAIIVVAVVVPLCCCGCFGAAAYFMSQNNNKHRGNMIVPTNQQQMMPMQQPMMSSPAMYMPQQQQPQGYGGAPMSYPYAPQQQQQQQQQQFSVPMAYAQQQNGYKSDMPPYAPQQMPPTYPSYPQAPLFTAQPIESHYGDPPQIANIPHHH